jgi:predicted MFS family arabinose efflux permease
VCAAVSALAPSVTLLLAARLLGGLAASVYGPAGAAAAIAAYPPTHHGRALGGLQASSSIAMIVGAPVGLVLAATVSWRAAFALVAGLAVVAVVGLLRSDVGAAPLVVSTARERLRPLRSRAVLGVLAATFLMMAASNSMYSYLGVLVGAATDPVGLWAFIAAFGVGGVLGTWWGGSAADRWGGPKVVLVAAALQTLVLAVLLAGSVSTVVELAIAVGWGFAGWALVTGQQHRLAGLGSRSASFVMALNSSAIQFGFGVGALLGGMMIDTAGAGALSALALGLGCAGVLVLASGLRAVRP